MKVYLDSLGCKLNQSEIEALGRGFAQAGHQLAQASEEADLCVVNTCTVTHVADRKSRQLIRRLRRANPTARFVVTGCYAEMSPQDLRAIDGVDLIAGNDDKERLVELAESLGRESCRSEAPIRNSKLETRNLKAVHLGHTRAFVKIQDGCNNRCAYCIVSLARGRERSRPRRDILAEIEALVAAGYKEVVLTGVHTGGYGRDLGADLGQLVEDILTQTRAPRLRLSSIEPWDLEPSLLHLWENPRLCRHLHLPLQSGCDATLRRMRRRYTTSQYADLIATARRLVPDLAVTTDIIVGLPGETAEEFAASLSFVEEIELARIHVFKYSARPGAAAAEMPHQVPYAEKKRRSETMLELAQRSSQRFHRRFLGQTMEVLWEMRCRGDKHKRGFPPWSGLTDNYIRVAAHSELDLVNTITSTKLVGLVEGGMRGEVETQPPPPAPSRPPSIPPTLGGSRGGESVSPPRPGLGEGGRGKRAIAMMKENGTMSTNKPSIFTQAVHAGERGPRPDFTPVVTPLYNSVGYLYDSMDQLDAVFAAEREGYVYPRYGSPTNAALERAVATLEGGAAAEVSAAALTFASGMAAIHAALLATGLEAGQSVVAAHDIYGASYALLANLFTSLGVRVRFIDIADLPSLERAIAEEKPKAVFCEIISNPLLKVADVPAVAELAHANGAEVVVDSTFATPYLVQPLALGSGNGLGADYVVHSSTKYLGGHGDVLGGIVVTSAERRKRLWELIKMTGGNLGPNEAWLTMRGLKTLPLRMAQHCRNAATVASWLDKHPRSQDTIARVNYPGLPSHPQHDVATRLFRESCYGGMISFEIAGADQAQVFRFMEALKLILPATTLGDVYSLILYPAHSSHRALSPQERAAIGIGEGLVRLSVGIEDVEDIVADLDQALEQVGV